MSPQNLRRVLVLVLLGTLLGGLPPCRGAQTPLGAPTPHLQPTQALDAELHPRRHQTAAFARLQRYVPHEPISVRTNRDFTRLGFPGEGTEENPYVIEGLDITSTDFLIDIRDTTAYFCIRNNFLNGLTGSNPGIMLWNVTHGTIDANIISNCFSGISLGVCGYNTVAHNTLAQNHEGIALVRSGGNILAHNIVANNSNVGIHLDESGQNILIGNTLANNGVCIFGLDVEDYIQANVTKNVVNGRPLVFWQQVWGGTIPPGAGQVVLINTTAVKVTGQDLSRASIGVLAAFSSHLDIHHNTLAQNRQAGIHLHNSWNNNISYNTITNCEAGIGLYGARYSLYGTYPPVCNVIGKSNTLTHNTIANNTQGIYLMASTYNTISYNTIANNTRYGIDIPLALALYVGGPLCVHGTLRVCAHGTQKEQTLCEYNTVIWNDFLGNNPGGHSQAHDGAACNAFAGNYWDDHDNTDRNEDGIADIPYAIAGTAENQDLSPLATLTNLSVVTEIEIPTFPEVPTFEVFPVLLAISFLLCTRRRYYRK